MLLKISVYFASSTASGASSEHSTRLELRLPSTLLQSACLQQPELQTEHGQMWFRSTKLKRSMLSTSGPGEFSGRGFSAFSAFLSAPAFRAKECQACISKPKVWQTIGPALSGKS